MLGRQILTRALQCSKNLGFNASKVATRNSHGGVWSYREVPPPASKRVTLLAEVLGGICWWWILWHIATEPEHIYGEWPYIEPHTWTDEELGIPPDTAGSLRKAC